MTVITIIENIGRNHNNYIGVKKVRKIKRVVGVVNLSKNLEEIKSIVALWGFKDKLDIREEDISYATDREPHIRIIIKEIILKEVSI